MAFKSYQSFNLLKKSAHEQNKFIVNLNNTITQKTKKWMEDTNTLLETKDTPQLYTKVRELYDMIQVVQRNLSDSNEYLKLIEGQMDLSETIYDIRELLKFLWEKVVSHNGDEGNKFVLNVDDRFQKNSLVTRHRFPRLCCVFWRIHCFPVRTEKLKSM